MSRIVIPVIGRTLWATGDVLLWANLKLLVKDNAGGWQPETFRVDTATDITTFPAHRAKRLNLPIPIKAATGATHTQTGLEIRSGLLDFRTHGMDATEYAVACFFLGDPLTSPTGNRGTFALKTAPAVGAIGPTPLPFRQECNRGCAT
jgi:hypothetical protein